MPHLERSGRNKGFHLVACAFFMIRDSVCLMALLLDTYDTSILTSITGAVGCTFAPCTILEKQ